MSTSAVNCPDCGKPTPTGGWVDRHGVTHHVGCGDPLGTKAQVARIAELESFVRALRDDNCVSNGWRSAAIQVLAGEWKPKH